MPGYNKASPLVPFVSFLPSPLSSFTTKNLRVVVSASLDTHPPSLQQSIITVRVLKPGGCQILN